MTDLQISNLRPVSIDLHHEIEQFLFREARMLDQECLREWLTTIVDPDICYQMVMYEERFRKDKSPAEAREVYAYDDNYAALDLRVRQFETGLQTMLDPPQRTRRAVTSIEAFHHDQDGSMLSCPAAQTQHQWRVWLTALPLRATANFCAFRFRCLVRS